MDAILKNHIFTDEGKRELAELLDAQEERNRLAALEKEKSLVATNNEGQVSSKQDTKHKNDKKSISNTNEKVNYEVHILTFRETINSLDKQLLNVYYRIIENGKYDKSKKDVFMYVDSIQDYKISFGISEKKVKEYFNQLCRIELPDGTPLAKKDTVVRRGQAVRVYRVKNQYRGRYFISMENKLLEILNNTMTPNHVKVYGFITALYRQNELEKAPTLIAEEVIAKHTNLTRATVRKVLGDLEHYCFIDRSKVVKTTKAVGEKIVGVQVFKYVVLDYKRHLLAMQKAKPLIDGIRKEVTGLSNEEVDQQLLDDVNFF